METVLKYLSGKKGYIGSIVGLFIGYFFAKQWIDEPTFILLGGLQVLIFQRASSLTGRMYGKKK